MDSTEQVRPIVQVTRMGLWLNVVLLVLKIAVGLAVGSVALIADGVHSVSDLLTDFVVLVGVRLSSRPADSSHEYGHGRYETIAASVVGTILVLAGLFIAAEAGLSVHRGQVSSPGYPVLAVALVSIVSKEWIFRATRQVARRVNSQMLHVNAWHHRSDALSSVAVLVGAVAGLAGWGHGDHVAAIAVGLMIVMVGGKAVWRCFQEISEGSVSESERENIIDAIQGVTGVRGWHHLRSRLVGREAFMDVHIFVDPYITVQEGHEVCTAVEHAVTGCVDRTVNIVVHCEPARGRSSEGP